MAHDQSPQDRLIELLVHKIENDRFPSNTMMEFVERQLDREHLEQYLHVLLDKIENDRFPSIEMMRRVEKLTMGGSGG